MYSGNHSPCHPLDTLLAAAQQLADHSRFAFCFVGGGSEFRKIQQMVARQKLEGNSRHNSPRDNRITDHKTEEPLVRNQRSEASHQNAGTGREPVVSRQWSEVSRSHDGVHAPITTEIRKREMGARDSGASRRPVAPRQSNILCLPYQPLDELAGSLSAADLHVVVLGDPFVGLIHPCKIYNALAVGAPILCIGPESSHLSEILAVLGSRVCARVGHGNVDACATQISRIAEKNQRGESDRYETVTAQFSQRVLLSEMVAELERPAGA
jgi:hypothetical protein